MSALNLYDTATREVGVFKPLIPGQVSMYVCGATVQSHPHIGHVRSAVNFDILRRWLTWSGYDVTFIRNVTDIDDKILHKAVHEKSPWWAVAMKYERIFTQAFASLNVLPPTYEPRATGHITQMVELMQKLIDNGAAYAPGNGDVYLEVRKLKRYLTLSGQKLDDLQPAADADETYKKDPRDFALWKAAKSGDPSWPTPWGAGRPGWHLECSAMAHAYLGEAFDIHGGGMDLKFPHHECEIAQNEAAKGKSPVNYWMHANMLELNGQRMSKTTGNTVNPDELLSGNNKFFTKAYGPSVIRFFNAMSSYRSILDLTNDGLLASEKGFNRLMDAVNLLDDLKASSTSSIGVLAWKQKCYDAMNDDFNSPILLAHLFEAAKYINQIKEGSETLSSEDLDILKDTINIFVYDVLGLKNTAKSESGTDKLSGAVDVLIRLRQDARANKDFAMSDKIRDELAEVGIQLKDGKDGTTFSTN